MKKDLSLSWEQKIKNAIQKEPAFKDIHFPDTDLLTVYEYLKRKKAFNPSQDNYEPILKLKPYVHLVLKETPITFQNQLKTHILKNHSFFQQTINFDKIQALTTENLISFRNQHNINIILKNYFSCYQHKKNLFLHGALDTGKTYFFKLLLKHFLNSQKDFLFIFMPDFIRQFKINWYDETTEKKMKILSEVAVLLLDDFGFGTMTEYFRNDILLSIFEARLNNNLPILINTSLNKEELYHYLQIKNDKQNLIVATKIMKKLEKSCQYYTLNHNPQPGLKLLYSY